MCISDLSVVHEKSFDEAICESAAAYFLQCKLEGVQLKLPNYCGKCAFFIIAVHCKFNKSMLNQISYPENFIFWLIQIIFLEYQAKLLKVCI